MTDQRRVPTPADLAAGAAPQRMGAPPAAAATRRPAYDRTRWEAAVLERRLHYIDTLVALVLAHYAGPGGVLAKDGVQRTDRMRKVINLSPDSTRLALKNLQKAGLLSRPSSDGRPTDVARPITLTVPVRRERPPHTGERP